MSHSRAAAPLRPRVVVIALALTTSLGGCSMFALKEDLKRMETVGTISGTVERESDSVARITVVLGEPRVARDAVLDYVVISEPGTFRFFVHAGEYFVLGFEDTNGNGSYEPGEPAAFHGVDGAPSIIQVAAGEAVEDIDLKLASTTRVNVDRGPAGEGGRASAADLPKLRLSTQNIGKVVALDEARFDPAVGEMAMWQPVAYATEYGAGLFFLGDFDPQKVPIVFVHGIGGTPRSFTDAVAGLDGERFQAWVLQYPSGLPLDLSAEYLEKALRVVEDKYRFTRYALVAHSMGGLVSRRFINRVRDDPDLAPAVFVTMSTPWGGHAAAQMGLTYSPQVIPVWNDLAPDSEFLRSLHATPLPPGLPHHLLFSYEGDSMMMSGADDGTVTIASQLYMPTQRSATRVQGFAVDHVGILSSEDALEALYAVLDDTFATPE